MFARHIYNSPAGFLVQQLAVVLTRYERSEFLSLYYIIIISYIFIFVNAGNHMRALVAYFASEASQSDEGFPGCLRARRAQTNKLLWRIWASTASQFREPEDSYEGQLSIEKNAIWGCVGLVGRCPVVSAPPLYHIHFCLSSKIF